MDESFWEPTQRQVGRAGLQVPRGPVARREGLAAAHLQTGRAGGTGKLGAFGFGRQVQWLRGLLRRRREGRVMRCPWPPSCGFFFFLGWFTDALGLYLHLEVARAAGSLQRGRRGAVQQLHGVIHCGEQRRRRRGTGPPLGVPPCAPGDPAHLVCRGWAGWAALSGGPASQGEAGGWG